MLTLDRRSFLQTFAPTCTLLRSRPGKFNLKRWVNNHVIPQYIIKFPDASVNLEERKVSHSIFLVFAMSDFLLESLLLVQE